MAVPHRDHDQIVYLDNAATTPLRPEALEAMMPFLTDRFGNPSGGHRMARDARLALDEARDDVAEVLGCGPGEVVFTGGGTEADNLAVLGTVAASGGTAVCPATEHHAVLHSVEAVGGRFVGAGLDGAVDLAQLEATLEEMGERVTVVSAMTANNEVGTLTPLDEVAAVMAERAPGAVLHTDAVQAAGWCDLRELAAQAQLVSVAAHKLGGPKGVGCLVVRSGTPLRPLLHGGGQERDLRSGTHNLAGIVGFATALRLAADERDEVTARAGALRAHLLDRLVHEVGGVVASVALERALPGHLHVRIEGCEGEAMLVLLDDSGVCASAGSACASGAVEPSHVLAAMGVAKSDALTSLRLSIGRTTSEADVDVAATAVASAAARLRAG
ncbi:MAG: cysteine desulfurase family protein [Acidimicrobiales bacterium]